MSVKNGDQHRKREQFEGSAYIAFLFSSIDRREKGISGKMLTKMGDIPEAHMSLLRSVPIPSISISTISPAFSQTFFSGG